MLDGAYEEERDRIPVLRDERLRAVSIGSTVTRFLRTINVEGDDDDAGRCRLARQ